MAAVETKVPGYFTDKMTIGQETDADDDADGFGKGYPFIARLAKDMSIYQPMNVIWQQTTIIALNHYYDPATAYLQAAAAADPYAAGAVIAAIAVALAYLKTQVLDKIEVKNYSGEY